MGKSRESWEFGGGGCQGARQSAISESKCKYAQLRGAMAGLT